ncbi:MAG: DsbA family protein [Pseudomonadota bacterium]
MRLTGSPTVAAAALALGLVAAPLPAKAQLLDYDAMSSEERAAFGNAVRAYLMDNPEVIAEVIERLQETREADERARDSAAVSQYLGALYDTEYAYVGGNPDGDVTIVEFLDYRCGFCKRAHPEVITALEEDPDIRLIVKEFPILGPDSVVAGRMAMAANRIDPELYATLNDELMSFQGDLTETMAYRIAGVVGYDIADLKALAGSEEIEAQIERNYMLAEALGIRGTPTFIVGTEIVRGAVAANELLAMAARQREEHAAAN